MIVKHFKLSQPEKDRLIRIKAKTGIQNWNVLCRWALCWSLAEPSIPGGVDPLSDSNVEMDWSTFAGEYSEIYEAITVLFPVFYVCEAVACFRKKHRFSQSGSQSSGRISAAVASYLQPMYIANSNEKDRPVRMSRCGPLKSRSY